MRAVLAILLLLTILIAAGCGGSSDDSAEPTDPDGSVEVSPEGGDDAPADFCAASERFAQAEADSLEQGDTADGRRAAALATADAFAELTDAAPAEIRVEADTVLAEQRGYFAAQDELGWGEDALEGVDAERTDELLAERDQYYGEEYFVAEDAVIAFVRMECDPAFLEG